MERILDRTPGGDENSQLSAIEQTLRALSRRDILHYLRHSIRDPARVERIAHRSSVHANGFAKVVLERKNGMAVRLHLWRSAGQDEGRGENIHDHVWAFGSKVLAGGLCEQRFETGYRGEEVDGYRYVRDRSTLPPGVLERCGSRRLHEVTRLIHGAGNAYGLDSSGLHRSWAGGEHELTATLVITARPTKDYALVFVGTGSEVRQDVSDPRIPEEQVIRLVELVASAV